MGQTIAEAYLNEGRIEGRVGQLRTDIQRALTIRFGILPETVILQITGVEDLARLDAAFEQALRLEKLDEFRL